MTKMKTMFEQAKEYMVGGCCASGRFHYQYGQPVLMERADGARLWDVDGKEYIEFHSSAGPILYGYNNPRLNHAVEEALKLGNFCNFETKYTTELAKAICEIIPCAEKVRLANTGTEATLSAIRLARGYTGRDIVIRMEGHFHGMHELIWYNHTQIGAMNKYGEIENIPDSGGFCDIYGNVVKTIPFNNIDILRETVERYKDQVAAIIMEPISFNCGCYPARKEYLQQVRELCDKENIVLIFDEVISGFRMRPGSAQAYYGVTPDVTTLAKALGGGAPIAAICGKKKVMDAYKPIGTIGSSGTTTGALMPVMMACECMKMVKEPGFYDHLESIGNQLYDGINDLFKKHQIPGHVRGMGARFAVYFGVEDPEDDYDYRTVWNKFDNEMDARFVRECIEAGLYMHDYGMGPAPAHRGFGTAHTAKDINIALEKMDTIFARLKTK